VVWDPAKYMKLLPAKVTVQIEGRDVRIQSWMYQVISPTGGKVPILFLDTDLPENAEQDRCITDCLYGGDSAYRIKQESCSAWAACACSRPLNSISKNFI